MPDPARPVPTAQRRAVALMGMVAIGFLAGAGAMVVEDVAPALRLAWGPTAVTEARVVARVAEGGTRAPATVTYAYSIGPETFSRTVNVRQVLYLALDRDSTARVRYLRTDPGISDLDGNRQPVVSLSLALAFAGFGTGFGYFARLAAWRPRA